MRTKFSKTTYAVPYMMELTRGNLPPGVWFNPPGSGAVLGAQCPSLLLAGQIFSRAEAKSDVVNESLCC